MNKLTKKLFPFHAKYTYLNRYWWHRLFVAIFFALVFAILFLVFTYLNKSEMDPYSACISLNLSLNKAINQVCDVFAVHPKINFMSALFAALASNYIMQLIYYKIFIYIVFGKKTDNSAA